MISLAKHLPGDIYVSTGMRGIDLRINLDNKQRLNATLLRRVRKGKNRDLETQTLAFATADRTNCYVYIESTCVNLWIDGASFPLSSKATGRELASTAEIFLSDSYT